MRKKKNKKFFIILLILFLGIGFSLISSNISFDGFAKFRKHKFDVRFDNIQDEYVSGGSIVTSASIGGSAGDNLVFNASLDGPGSNYKFFFDVVNNGTEDIILRNFNVDGYDFNEELHQYLYISISSLYGTGNYTMDWATPTVFPHIQGLTIKSGDRITFELNANYLEESTAINDVYDFTVTLNYEPMKNDDPETQLTFSNVLMKKSVELNGRDVTSANEIHEPVVFHQRNTVQEDPRMSYRFIGSDPYNYVRFNNELWRIIGVFKLDSDYYQNGYFTKIVKTNSINGYTFNDGRSSGSFVDGSVFTYLNGTFLNTINEDNRRLIWWGTRYYESNFSPSTNTNIDVMHEYEKNGTYFDSFDGQVGLMYPSDYLYTFSHGVDDDCANNFNCTSSKRQKSWLYSGTRYAYEMMMSNIVDGAAIFFNSTNMARYDNAYGKNVDIRPVVYLSGEVVTTGGTGTSTDPYIITYND